MRAWTALQALQTTHLHPTVLRSWRWLDDTPLSSFWHSAKTRALFSPWYQSLPRRSAQHGTTSGGLYSLTPLAATVVDGKKLCELLPS
jgi:hypothetical protein